MEMTVTFGGKAKVYATPLLLRYDQAGLNPTRQNYPRPARIAIKPHRIKPNRQEMKITSQESDQTIPK